MRNLAVSFMCVILFVVSIADTYAQLLTDAANAENDQIKKQMPRPVPKSPNVAALDKFGDYPVDYFSGVPDISIPIFTITSGALSVPITMSYHASGIKPTDRAGWVGLGWALSAGGQVSRSVQGKKDEEYLYSNPVNMNVSICSNYQYIKDVNISNRDAEPDKFSYSFPGHSGKFFLNPTNATLPPYLFPYAPILVNPVYTSNAFTRFDITDETGVLHRFGTNTAGTTVAQESTVSTSGGSVTANAVSAWYLQETTSPNSDDNIYYSYQAVGTATSYDVSQCITLKSNCSSMGDGGTFDDGCPFPYQTFTNSGTSSTVDQLGLNVITFKTGKVEFFLGNARLDDSNQKYLDHIAISSLVSGSYILQKTVTFGYSYFVNATGGRAGLRLDSVKFQDNVGQTVEQYRFSYFTNSFSWDGSNPNFPNARDLWGFYNGALQNTDLIVKRTFPFTQTSLSGTDFNYTIGGAVDRTVNQNFILEGTLQRIDFPTGGFTAFEFESNQYDNNGTPTTAGGLRIKKITSDDGTGAPAKTKTYRYGNTNSEAESGVGTANFSPYQFNYVNTLMVNGFSCSGESLQTLGYTSNNFYSNSTFNYPSYPVMYPYVTEYLGDVNGLTSGRTKFEYDGGQTFPDAAQVLSFSSKSSVEDLSWKRAKLTHSYTYDKDGNLLEEEQIGYSPYNDTIVPIRLLTNQRTTFVNRDVISRSCFSPCTNEVGDVISQLEYEYNVFFQSTGILLESDRIKTQYENGNLARFTRSESSKIYDNAKSQLIKTVSDRSDQNQQRVTINRYPFQLSAGSSTTGLAKGIYLLNSKNIVSTPIESYSYLQNNDGSNQRLVSGQVTSFKQNPANGTQVVRDQIFLWESAQPTTLASYAPAVVSGNNLVVDANQKAKINLSTYDAYGNVLTASKVNDVSISYQYGYNHALPVAEVQNASTGEFFYEGFEESGLSGVVTYSSAAHTGNRFLNSDYTTTFVKPNGRAYTIDYWYQTGITWQYITKVYTGSGMVLSEGASIDDVRIFPSDARMKSYTYDPLTGITSVIEEGSLTHWYDYDSFGRLKRIRNDKGEIEKQYIYNYKGN